MMMHHDNNDNRDDDNEEEDDPPNNVQTCINTIASKRPARKKPTNSPALASPIPVRVGAFHIVALHEQDDAEEVAKTELWPRCQCGGYPA